MSTLAQDFDGEPQAGMRPGVRIAGTPGNSGGLSGSP
jgi:hypothetical protein